MNPSSLYARATIASAVPPTFLRAGWAYRPSHPLAFPFLAGRPCPAQSVLLYWSTEIPGLRATEEEEMAGRKADPRLSFSDQYRLAEDLGK